MTTPITVSTIEFPQYKALGNYSIRLAHVNILVGANNSGKSTILGALRVLSLGIRIARTRRPDMLIGPDGVRPGWALSEDALPISIENIQTDYKDVDTVVRFKTSNRAILTLFFPQDGGCKLFAEIDGDHIRNATSFKKKIPLDLVIVPVLGPVEHREKLVQEETVRKNLITTRASRNFRNYWLCNPDGFFEFRKLVQDTWPGMDVEEPERLDNIVGMICLEGRMSRELYWSGFGFQIWLQLLTHISRAKGSSMIVVDEPELYLHPDVQRQLLTILREAGPDILLATHSTEIMSEADPSELLSIDKTKSKAIRLRDVEGVQAVLGTIGSVQNITLSRLARNKRMLFVEDDYDFQLIRKFARKSGLTDLAAGLDITPVRSGGFSGWTRVRNLVSGFEEVLKFTLHVGAIFDRDYWCNEEIEEIKSELEQHLELAHLHERKEIENYLLVPNVLQRALESAVQERFRRTGIVQVVDVNVEDLLEEICEGHKSHIQSQYIAKRVKYFEKNKIDNATATKDAVEAFDALWTTVESKLDVVSGKSVLPQFRSKITELYSVTLTDYRIVSAFKIDEVPADMRGLLKRLNEFRLK